MIGMIDGEMKAKKNVGSVRAITKEVEGYRQKDSKMTRKFSITILVILVFSPLVSGENQRQDSLEEASGLTQKAHELSKAGRYGEAIPYAKRSLEITERALGKNHPDVAINLNDLANLHVELVDYAEADRLYKRSLEITENASGKDHPNVAMSLNNLAELYRRTGRYAEAEPLYKRSLEIVERAYGKDHSDVAISLTNLAEFYRIIGRYAEVEPLCKRALEIKQKVLSKDHPDIAIGLNNLALLYRETGRYTEAEPLYKRALDIFEKALGKEHPYVSISLNNLAELYCITGEHGEAESFYKKTLEIRERVLGKNHPAVATSLNGLAVLYYFMGRYVEAVLLCQRALVIHEKTLGKEHPDVATSLDILATLYAITNRWFEGHRMLSRGIGIEEKKREDVFLVFSEKQKLAYMDQNKSKINGFITHTARYLQNDSLAVKDTFDAWIKWKGAVMEAQGRYIDAVTYSENPNVKKEFEELNNIRRSIARLQLSGAGKMDFDEYKKRIEELEKKRESLEAELSRLSKDFSLEKMVGRADAKTISEVLLKKGTDSVYIDFAHIDTYDFKEKKFDKPRYLAFVLLPGREPLVKLIDLSAAEGVDSHIRVYLKEMKRAKEYGMLPRERVLRAEAKAIYEALIKPIESHIKGKKELYISPDGNLNLIPFEVLMTPEGKYLMEDHLITYITAGRDIMRFMDTAIAKAEALIMADPDYDMGLEEKERVAKAMGVPESRMVGSISRDATGFRFERLPDTKIEADAIEKVLLKSQKTNVRNYQDKKALEEVLLSVKEPRILHLSTHGYFLKDEEVKNQQMMRFISHEGDQLVDIGIENPMLRSGIVLAGVNASLKEGKDDGVVSADKILGLKLKGTDLVVLSACETGVGDVKSGEGVFGLKRSFILSGAKTVVMSLWSVPSKETVELMTDFYTLMAMGKSKADALMEARLNLMKKKSNPFYWGAFVMVGNPD
jgi:CHAT domain-containing protein